MIFPTRGAPAQTLPSPSLGPPKLSLSPSPPPFCGIPGTPLDPELPEPDPEPLELPEPDPELPEVPEPDPELLEADEAWCL
jgi:hypothetical protein